MLNPLLRDRIERALLASARRARFTLACGTLEAAYAAALPVLTEAMGPQWINTNISTPSKKSKFFQVELSDNQSRIRHYMRVINLAEMLINLRHVPGFNAVHHNLMYASVEDTFAELETAKLLIMAEVEFEFRVPSKTKGEDYDLDIKFCGQEAAAETKCKREITAIGGGTLSNSFKTAKPQFPEGKPALIFVKCPHNWISDGNLVRIFESATNAFFRSNSGIAAIYLYGSIDHDLGSHVCPVTVTNAYLNERRDSDRAVQWDKLLDDYRGTPSWWLDIGKIAADGRGAMIPSENGNVFISEG